ncbi:EAL domain-containing protein [Roseixanthobacter glucoisosaccharinicivorans]|uniref:EAL domain-containing protein n=1 Tax=Roseixanthobacter glucoisosaccharinicivorans TaxID=3119923 RepID=UPI00372BDC3D
MSPQGKCKACQDGAGFDLPITMAFQPMVNIQTRTVFAYEALVRGAAGEGAGQILHQVSDENLYSFDQTCRVKAIELATGLRVGQAGECLSINFLPNAVYEPRACIRATLETALRCHFPLHQIIFEFTEVEKLDTDHLLNILTSYRSMGFKTAIDDFGAGYAGLGLLSKFQPDLVKIDMGLVRNIDVEPVKRTIVRGTLRILADLGITALCEGVETQAEYEVLGEMGVALMQGYLFGQPALAAVQPPIWPEGSGLRALSPSP